MDKVVYLCIHKRLFEEGQKTGGFVNKRKASLILAKLYHIPRNLRYVVLKELNNMNLIEMDKKETIKILKPIKDIGMTSQFFKNAGLF